MKSAASRPKQAPRLDAVAGQYPTLELAATLYTLEQLREAGSPQPHIAFVGRSNVGKSSLLNALARRKQLAKVSSTPGKTRSVKLFTVLPDGFYPTDLPGYG
jgi:GTP-binding protein